MDSVDSLEDSVDSLEDSIDSLDSVVVNRFRILNLGLNEVVEISSVLGTNPGGLLIFNTSSNLVAPFSLTASIVSLGSSFSSSRVILLGSSSMSLSSSTTSFSSLSPGNLILTTSRILVDPSLFTAETVTALGAKVISSCSTSLISVEDSVIVNLVIGILAKLATPFSFVGLSSLILVSKVSVVVESKKKTF